MTKSVAMIAAIGKNNELGKNGDLIWHFREDMQFFKNTTLGSAVIMGRKTFESLPKALPNRKNIVITSDKDYRAEGAVTAASLTEAMKQAEGEDVFIIGGARVYGEFLPLCDRLYLTEIDAEDSNADVFFPSFDKSDFERKKLTDFTVNGIHFSHILYTRTEKQ